MAIRQPTAPLAPPRAPRPRGPPRRADSPRSPAGKARHRHAQRRVATDIKVSTMNGEITLRQGKLNPSLSLLDSSPARLRRRAGFFLEPVVHRVFLAQPVSRVVGFLNWFYIWFLGCR